MLPLDLAPDHGRFTFGLGQHAFPPLAVKETKTFKVSPPEPLLCRAQEKLPILEPALEGRIEKHPRLEHPPPDQATRLAQVHPAVQQQRKLPPVIPRPCQAEHVDIGIDPIRLWMRLQLCRRAGQGTGTQSVVGVQHVDRPHLGR